MTYAILSWAAGAVAAAVAVLFAFRTVHMERSVEPGGERAHSGRPELVVRLDVALSVTVLVLLVLLVSVMLTGLDA